MVDDLESSVANGLDEQTDERTCPACGSEECVKLSDDEVTCLDCGEDSEVDTDA